MKREKNFTSAKDWQKSIPRPVCEAHKDFIPLYEKAWALAHDHIKDVPGLPATPYMDEAVRAALDEEAAALGFASITWIKTGCVITCHGGAGAFGIVGKTE